jgi:hypothetical protein
VDSWLTPPCLGLFCKQDVFRDVVEEVMGGESSGGAGGIEFADLDAEGGHEP